MIKTGKVIDSDNLGLVGATIVESDNLGNYKQPITKVVTTDINGNFNSDFIPNKFYTISFIGYKKYIFNSNNVLPNVIQLQSNLTTDEVNISSTKTYYKYIPLALLLLLFLLKIKK